MDSVRRDAWTHGANGASRGRGRRFPLGALILRYFAYVLVALLALALVAYAAFGVLVGSGTVLLANYGDTALDETSARLAGRRVCGRRRCRGRGRRCPRGRV